MGKTSKKQVKVYSVLAIGVLVATLAIGPNLNLARAASLEEQIKALEAQRGQDQSSSANLGAQATGIQGQINDIQNQIVAIQVKIDTNTARQTELNQQIEAAQKKLEEQKDLLSANIRSMYIEGDISPLEMIASSKNLSDFMDKQEYRDRIKDSISNTMDEIERLKKQLDEQKQEVTAIINEQTSLKGTLAQKEGEASAKLAATNQEKAGFDSAIKQKTAQLADLRAQQRAANRGSSGGGGTIVASGSGGGGYPYNNVSYPCWGGAGCVDPWGLYKRECVSYTAFKVQQAGKRMPYFGGRGNAKEWPSTAASFGISSGSEPREKSVAISYAGPYGHSMWVEQVLPGGRIKVSEYNYGVDGRYTERIIPSAGLTYIYF